MADRRPQTAESHRRSAVGRLPSRVGWLLVAIGAVTDAIYHAPTILFGLQWPPAVDAIGEFGHTVIFVGIVIIIFSMLRKHSRYVPGPMS